MPNTRPIRAVTHGRSAPRVSECWQSRTPFTTGGAVRGEYVAWMPHAGYLSDAERAQLSADIAEHRRLFVVFSYATPIGWQSEDGSYAYRVSQRFSVTTSRHSGMLWGERASRTR